mmetsp:Transcript_27513/g.40994  ORF Transcript_27513/g.40994 Transcript_27513/m.40994 type:complete len:91 (-) Transcript_27513:134-406(-)
MSAVAIRVRGVRRCHAIVMRAPLVTTPPKSSLVKMRLRISIMIELLFVCCLNIDDVFSEFSVQTKMKHKSQSADPLLLTFLHNCSSKPNL